MAQYKSATFFSYIPNLTVCFAILIMVGFSLTNFSDFSSHILQIMLSIRTKHNTRMTKISKPIEEKYFCKN